MARTGQIERLTSIIAIDKNGAIGCRNSLPWRLKSDMAFFRETTSGNTVIMGRKTYESIGGPLADRKNIVLSHDNLFLTPTPGCQLALSIEDALARAGRSRKQEIFVIGGAVTYEQFSGLVDRYLITFVDHQALDADAFLSREILEQLEAWPKMELASYLPSPGKDQFGFKIFELQAPNIGERQEMRASIVHNYLTKIRKPPGTKTKVSGEHCDIAQVAFAF